MLSGVPRDVAPQGEESGEAGCVFPRVGSDRPKSPFISSETRLIMITVTFTGVCPGTCSFCRKEKSEVFFVSDEAARDPRPWCSGCLWKKVRLEVEVAAEKPGAALAPAVADASGRALS